MAELSALMKGESTAGTEYVTFSLNEEMYAIDARNVQEIIELSAITKVPHLPAFLKGVINLRGTIIPVVDLKLKFGMQCDGYRKHTCIIVTEFSGGVMGLIVDFVSDVLNMPEEAITTTPSFGAKIRTDFIRGMGRIGETLIIVLDVDRVLSDDEVPLLHSTVRHDPAAPEHQEGGAEVQAGFIPGQEQAYSPEKQAQDSAAGRSRRECANTP